MKPLGAWSICEDAIQLVDYSNGRSGRRGEKRRGEKGDRLVTLNGRKKKEKCGEIQGHIEQQVRI